MSEARDRIIWLHDYMKCNDADIAEYLGIARESVCRIRNGKLGYSGDTLLKLLRELGSVELNGVSYTYPQKPDKKRRPSLLTPTIERCYFCRIVKKVRSIGDAQKGQNVLVCDDCFRQLGY